MRTRVKICGITRQEDADAVAASGADAIGLNFYPQSPRYIEPATAADMARRVAPFVTITGLFVNAASDVIRSVLESVPVGLLQFHGSEQNSDCVAFGLPFIKSIAMKPGVDVAAAMSAYPDATGFLLDAWQPETHGGGGKVFNWDDVPASAQRPIILAGGLTPDNVAEAVRRTRPFAVDVSSGVESEPGIKSVSRISEFMTGVEQGGTD